jgi:hypothetical protein
MPASCSASTVARSSAQAAGAEAGIGGEVDDRVVAPGVGEAEGRQVALVDPGGDRHELDGRDVEPAQVVEDRGVAKGGDRPALVLGHGRVAHGEGADRDLVDQAAGPEAWRGGRDRRREGGDDRLRDQARGVVAVAGKPRVEAEGAV